MNYGDTDTYGDPRRLIEAFQREAERLGIMVDCGPLNAYDIGITTTGPSLAALVSILRAVDHAVFERDAIIAELVDFPDS